MNKLLAEYRPTTVGDLTQQVRGVSYKKHEASSRPEPGKSPVLRANNIDDCGLNFEDLVYVPNERISEKQFLQPGDIVFAASSGSLSVVGKAALLREKWKGSFGAFCKVLRPNPDVDPGYLSHYFRTPEYRHTISRLAAGANINNLRNEHLDNLPISLPPIDEQKRIAAILDKADGIRRKRAEAIRLADDFLKSAFLDMFGDPVTNPKGWNRKPFRKLLDGIDSGKSPRCLDRPADESEWGVLKLGAVTYCTYNPSANKALPSDVVPDESNEVHVGDLLFTRKNTYDLVGASALVHETPPRLLMPDLIFRLRLKPSDEICSEYLWGLLTCSTKRKQVQSLAGGAAGSMPNISKSRLEGLAIELPDYELQLKYRDILYRKRSIFNAGDAYCQLSGELFDCLAQQAFQGGL